MRRLHYLPVFLALGSQGRAQDSQQSPDVLSGLLSTREAHLGALNSCLMDSTCQKAGRKITIDDIILASDSRGNQKCCPRGTEFDGTRCVYPESSVCPPNMNFRDGVCVLTAGPSCAEKGLVPTKDGCVSIAPPTCPPSASLQNGQCVLKQDPICPPGQKLTGGSCAVSQAPKCPKKGFYVKDNLCVSVDGPSCQYDWLQVVGDRCVHVQRPGCPANTSPDGNGRCVSTERPSCPSGFSTDDNRCVRPSEPACPAGATLQNSVCVAQTPPSCSHGSMEDGFCVDAEAPKCPKHFKFDRDSSFCKQRSDPVCQSSYVSRYHRDTGLSVCCPAELSEYDGVSCIKRKAGPSGCPPNSEALDGGCISHPGKPPVCDEGNGVITKGICYKRETATCASPLKFQGGKCVHDESPLCTEGTLSASGTQCIIPGPDCPTGSLALGSKCVSTAHTPECPSGLRIEGDACVGEASSDCPAGTTKVDEYCVHTSEKPTCPGSNTLFGDDCVLPVTAQCPDGTVAKKGNCISLENPVCSTPGFNYSPPQGGCVYTTGPVCNPPYQLRKGRCFADTDVRCPAGTVPQGYQCLAPADCAGDYTLEGGRCVHRQKPACPSPDTELDEKTGQCISRTSTPKCTQGQMTVDGQCVTQALCPVGLVPHMGFCVSLKPAECESGFRIQDNQCVMETGPTCPPGHSARGTDCVSTQPPVCPPGTSLDRDRCITGANYDCIIMGTCPEVGTP